MGEASKTGVLVGAVVVLSLALAGAAAWIVVQQQSVLPPKAIAPALGAPVTLKVESAPAVSPMGDVAQLEAENAELKAKLMNVEARLKEMEQLLKAEEKRMTDLVYGPLAVQIATGNELQAILKRLNDPLTDLQREAVKNELKGFLGDHDGQLVVFKGHVSKVKEKMLSSNLILNVEVLEGVKVSLEAGPEQKAVFEELNAGYEVIVAGRLKSSLVGKLLPGQRFTLSFIKSVPQVDYVKASQLLTQQAK